MAAPQGWWLAMIFGLVGHGGDVGSCTATPPSVEQVQPHIDGRAVVNSSLIRTPLVKECGAGILLGRPHVVLGTVVMRPAGASNGLPTANVETNDELIPAGGCTPSHAHQPTGPWRFMVANWGTRPIFGSNGYLH